jgi:predicted dehydrogenase
MPVEPVAEPIAADTGSDRALGVAVVGFGWMGAVHARSYLRVGHHFGNLPAVRLVAVAEAEADRRDDAVHRYGFGRGVSDWRELAEDPRVQAVSITAPNWLHREIGTAMAAAGKHVWIEKPVGLTAEDARSVAEAVSRAGVQSTVGFNYRNVPAVTRARELIVAGAIGTITHARVRLFSDYAAHPLGALSWRFERERGGPGVLGDLASHGVDLARFLLGELDSLIAETAVFIPQRPKPSGATSHYATAEGEPAPVENEDYVACLARTTTGARLILESSRVSVGEQCNYGFEVHGTNGLLLWDFRRMGELGVSVGESYQDQYVSTVFTGPGYGAYDAFQPGAALAMGFDDLKVIEAANFLRSIADGRPHGATIDDAVRSAVALEAMVSSAQTGQWVRLAP